jgi:hypothetical protein
MLHPANRYLSLSTSLFFIPLIAAAEVADKIPHVSGVWTWAAGVCIAVIVFFVSWWSVRVGIVTVVCWLIALIWFLHFDDKVLSDAIYAELGAGYYVHDYLAFLLTPLGVALGWIVRKRRKELVGK